MKLDRETVIISYNISKLFLIESYSYFDFNFQNSLVINMKIMSIS